MQLNAYQCDEYFCSSRLVVPKGTDEEDMEIYAANGWKLSVNADGEPRHTCSLCAVHPAEVRDIWSATEAQREVCSDLAVRGFSVQECTFQEHDEECQFHILEDDVESGLSGRVVSRGTSYGTEIYRHGKRIVEAGEEL